MLETKVLKMHMLSESQLLQLFLENQMSQMLDSKLFNMLLQYQNELLAEMQLETLRLLCLLMLMLLLSKVF